MDSTINRPGAGPLWLLAYALLGVLATACGAARASGNATPTLISQPTPDRTVDAVIRGLVTAPPLGTRVPGTPGTVAPTPLGGSPGHVAAPIVATPHLAPAPTAPLAPAVTAAAAPRLASPTLAPTRPPATLAPTAAPPRAATAAPEITRALPPTAAPAPTRAAPAAAPTAARPAPTAGRPAPTAAPLPTFGRGRG
ncbi:MAG TPA: hypothetical protein VFE37_04220 [Chloroflexota bacterium]|nr:hypothetical protein [Chloroflexota bacterium]